MERAHATGDGACGRLCLEWQDLSQSLSGRVCDYRHPLEWAAVLWPARQAIEGIHSMTPRSTVRCAIYTRVSTDQGLEQDFNSLDAISARSPSSATSTTVSRLSLSIRTS